MQLLLRLHNFKQQQQQSRRTRESSFLCQSQSWVSIKCWIIDRIISKCLLKNKISKFMFPTATSYFHLISWVITKTEITIMMMHWIFKLVYPQRCPTEFSLNILQLWMHSFRFFDGFFMVSPRIDDLFSYLLKYFLSFVLISTWEVELNSPGLSIHYPLDWPFLTSFCYNFL